MNTLITQQSEFGEFPVDIYSKLSNESRILFIDKFIDDELATDIVATLLLKDSENNEDKITLFLNSEGADIRSAFMIYDMMCLIDSPIETVCIGSVMNEVVMILTAGTPGMRYATKNSVISPSQLFYDRNQFSNLDDAKILLEQFKNDNKRMMTIIAECTGKTLTQVITDFERKQFMTANNALKYKLIDKVIGGTK